MKKALIILLIFLSFNLSGVTKYIATTGNDSNDGSEASPYLTFAKAVSVASAGDVFLVKDGTYRSDNGSYLALISCSGTAGNYITFQSENKYGAVLDGIVGTDTSEVCFAAWEGSEYIKIKDFAITRFNLNAIDINHEPDTYISSYWTIEGCKIYNIGNYETERNEGISGVFIARRQHHITIDKCWMYNIGRTGPDTYYLSKDHAIYTSDPTVAGSESHSNKFTRNLMYLTSGCPITMGSRADTIANNVFAWVNVNSQGGNTMIFSSGSACTDIVIANNVFYQLSAPSTFAIWASTGTTGWSVKNNMVYGGQMWYAGGSAGWATAMNGGNYGQIDCENAEVDPLFVNAVRADWANADFNIQGSSLAINHGVNMNMTTDYAGYAIEGNPDIGAYEYQSEITTYYNTQLSQMFTKNNCPVGLMGSSVAYTVTANTYTSIVSQQDANDQALADIAANGQAYANTNGTCAAGRSFSSQGKVVSINGKIITF